MCRTIWCRHNTGVYVTVDSEELIVLQNIWRYKLGVVQTDVVIAEGFKVTFNSEELNFLQNISRYRRGYVQTDAVITTLFMLRLTVKN